MDNPSYVGDGATDEASSCSEECSQLKLDEAKLGISTLSCPKCGNALRDIARFCDQCGYRLQVDKFKQEKGILYKV